jgi:hypothetical protein
LGEPQPRSPPARFGRKKKGSNTCARTSGFIPIPVSATRISTYGPRSAWSASERSLGPKLRSRTDTTSSPPCGMASRALIARLRRAASN